MIMKALDAGAYGVIVPMVSNRAEAERESVKIKLLEFFEREVDKKPKTKFAAIITDVRANGFFLELVDSMRGLDDWSFPIHAVAYDTATGTVLNHWVNRLPGTRPPMPWAETGQASLIQQHSSIWWM